MACQTYDNRHKDAEKRKHAFFDKFFPDNVGFIRPVRIGQDCPCAPREMKPDTTHYLVQDLDGDWIALINATSAVAVFAEIEANARIPVWVH